MLRSPARADVVRQGAGWSKSRNRLSGIPPLGRFPFRGRWTNGGHDSEGGLQLHQRALMRPIRYTLIDHVSAPVERVFALLTDPGRMADWLPGCDAVVAEGPLKRGDRFRVRFGRRPTEFEVVDFTPPHRFGWVERGERKGMETLFQLVFIGAATRVTIREMWMPQSLGAWVLIRP